MSTIKISELATNAISLTDFFAKADASGLASKNDIQGLSNFLNTVGTLAFRGVLLAADAAVTEDGIYVAGDAGTYTNNGGLVITVSNQIVLISITGTQTVFEKVEIPITLTIDAIPTEGSVNAVESGGVVTNERQQNNQLNQISDDFSFKTVQQWTPAGAGSETLEWLANSSEFVYGDYYFKLTKDASTSFQELQINIPSELVVASRKSVLRFSHKSTNDQKYTIYQYGSSGYLGISTDLIVNLSTNEAVIDFPFEMDANLTNIRFVVRSYGGTGNVIKIGSTRLYTLSDLEVAKNTKLSDSIIQIIEDNQTVTLNTVTVNPAGGADYSTLRAALKFVDTQTHSATNRWQVTCADGLYEEIDIAGCANALLGYPVKVIGASKEGVIIRTNGLSTSLSPSDYNVGGGAYDSIPINTIPQIYRHAFWIHENIEIHNMTVYSNDVKYCVHQDQNTGDYDSLFKNCHFIHEELTQTDYGNVNGIGSYFGQYQRYHDCTLEVRQPNTLGNGIGIGWHNIANQAGATGMEMINCHVINGNIHRAEELSSDHMDIIKIDGCSSSLRNAGLLLTLAQGTYSPTPATPEDYPYNIQYKISNTPINYADFQTGTRENAGFKYYAPDYHITVQNDSGSLIARGTAVKIDYSASPVYGYSVVKAVDNDFDFVLWKDIANGEQGFAVPKGKTVKFLSVGGTWVRGDWVKINSNGLAVITIVESERIGICEYDGLSGVGFLRTYLLN